ncbi:hypothetical protein [Streptomyces sp. NPDC045369]|uniref:hypothetical protein n=1 Tax=Streptomyces sp. NPDC045369 TaxID=3155732 RepID=UPI0033EB8C36
MSEDKRATAEGVRTCWSDSTPDEVHATVSGSGTLCGKPVAEVNSIAGSRLRDITCSECGGKAVFDEHVAATRVRAVLDKWTAAGRLSLKTAEAMGELTLAVYPGRAFEMRRKGYSWNKITTDFLLISGAYALKSNTDRFVGELGIAVFEGLQASEYQGKY